VLAGQPAATLPAPRRGPGKSPEIAAGPLSKLNRIARRSRRASSQVTGPDNNGAIQSTRPVPLAFAAATSIARICATDFAAASAAAKRIARIFHSQRDSPCHPRFRRPHGSFLSKTCE
jgi:hypothetical protein